MKKINSETFLIVTLKVIEWFFFNKKLYLNYDCYETKREKRFRNDEMA